MKILQLCKKNPFPPKDGEAIAILNMTEGFYHAGHELTTLIINTPKHQADVDQLPEEVRKMATFDTVFINTNVSVIDAFANLFTNNSYNIFRFHSVAFHNKLKQYLVKNEYDIIHLEGVYLSPYIKTIRKYSNAPVVMRAHNIEFEIWERLAEEQRNPLKKFYMRLLAKRLRQFELGMLKEYDALVPISVKDEAFFAEHGFNKPMMTSPASVKLDKYPHDYSKVEFPSLYFIGSLDWMPNQEGLNWFLEKVWLRIHQQMPTLKFYIAGRNIPESYKAANWPGVKVVGEVEIAIEFMQSKAMMVVPLFSGSGMRVKIIEAMALGKPIIATTVAAEGIAYTHKKNILIADDADNFTRHIRFYLQNHEFCNEIGRNARKFIEKKHENGVLIDSLIDFYSEL